MTKIIMNGCNGKMGQVITRLVSEDNECEIVAGFDVNDSIENTYPVFTNPDEFTGDADVIIDFSHPSALTTVLNYCKKRKLPVILATTGYTDEQKKEFTEASKEIPVFFSANMSLGINLIIALAKKATNDANAAIISINAAKEETQQATEEANAAKVASEAQTALAKTATDDANTAKNASVAQTALAKAATDNANAAAQAAYNAVSGVDAKVKAAVDALVAGAPEALDTLIELANALNNDPNFAATMATELGKKINVSDIVNNLTSGGTGKVLSAEQGKV